MNRKQKAGWLLLPVFFALSDIVGKRIKKSQNFSKYGIDNYLTN